MYNIFSNELYTFTKHNSLLWREQPHGLGMKNKTAFGGKNTTVLMEKHNYYSQGFIVIGISIVSNSEFEDFVSS
jgi:hypothetical protein